MPVTLRSRLRNAQVELRALRAAAQKLLDAAGYPRAMLSVTLVGDAAMRRLNRTYRGKDRPTDVLSFPIYAARELARNKRSKDGPVLLGDVIISVPTARRQAAAYEAPLRRELERLLIHGFLHLVGHDHQRRAERLRMIRAERYLARAIGMPWPY